MDSECVLYLEMTGEILKLTHVARGLDGEGVLLVDIVINGFVPPMLLTSNLNLQVSLSNSWVYSKCQQSLLQFSDFNVKWLLRNHSNMMICSLRFFDYYQ